jgi:hypothetical protein
MKQRSVRTAVVGVFLGLAMMISAPGYSVEGCQMCTGSWDGETVTQSCDHPGDGEWGMEHCTLTVVRDTYRCQLSGGGCLYVIVTP